MVKQRIHHANIKENLIEKNVIQFNGRKTIIVDLSLKTVMYEKKIMFEILLQEVVKMENIY